MARIDRSQYKDVIVAQKNGFVVGQISCEALGSRGSITCKVSDAVGNVLRTTRVSAHYYPPNDAQIRYNALTVPVLAGERYSVSQDETFPTITTSFSFVELA